MLATGARGPGNVMVTPALFLEAPRPLQQRAASPAEPLDQSGVPMDDFPRRAARHRLGRLARLLTRRRVQASAPRLAGGLDPAPGPGAFVSADDSRTSAGPRTRRRPR